MRTELDLYLPPIAMQPGGYIREAYADRTEPTTTRATVDIRATSGGHRVEVSWECPEPVSEVQGETDRWVDAVAVIAPVVPGAPWMTMGGQGAPVEGALWRADREELIHVRAEGLGSMARDDAPEGWAARSEHSGGRWTVSFELPAFASLAEQKQLAIAIWRGATHDRGGLKSVSPDWIAVDS